MLREHAAALSLLAGLGIWLSTTGVCHGQLSEEFFPLRYGTSGVFHGNVLPLQPVIPDQGTFLPADATEVIKGVETELDKLQKQAEEEKAAIQRKVDEVKRRHREQAIASLQLLQDKYTREARLDEAVAIRDRIRRLKQVELSVYRDPGTMYYFQSQIGKSFLFEVTGSAEGSIWGTEVYTGDSSIAKAAVHMGVLKPGQKGIVKVNVVESPAEYRSTVQHEVSSSSWSSYRFGFTVEPYREATAKP